MVAAERRLVEITGTGGSRAELLVAAYDEVLQPSFSHDELPSIEIVTSGFDTEGFHLVLVATTAEGRPMSTAVYSDDGSGVGILSYLATRPGARDRGLGALMMERLASIWADRPVEVVVGEVHDPRFYPETDADRAVSRMRFYHRCGSRLLDVPWMQPRLASDGDRVRHMLLLVFHLDPAAEARSAVPSALLARFAERYYVREEGAVPDDEAYRALWRRFTDRPAIAVRPLTDFDELQPLAIPGASA
jgi:GNAT superfamily N-acetyltransferase